MFWKTISSKALSLSVLCGLVAAALLPAGYQAATYAQPQQQAERGAGKQAGQDPCAVLENPAAMELISGPGEMALTKHCERIRQGNPPQADAPEAPATEAEVSQEPASAPEASVDPMLAADLLVNNRALDTFSNITQSEPSLAVNNSQILVGYNDSGQPSKSSDFTGYSRSLNGGATWADMGSLTTPLDNVSRINGDPVVAADRNRAAGQNGVFYFANLGVAVNPLNKSIISVHKTINAGTSWATARDASPSGQPLDFQDKEWMAVDTRASGTGAGNVYVCWTRFPSAGGNSIQFSRSTNGGASFTQQAITLAGSVQGCQVAVNPANGHVFVAWTDFAVVPPAMKIRRSTDFGATFGGTVTVGQAPFAETTTNCGTQPRRVFLDSEAGNISRAIRSVPFSSMAVNPTNGHIYLVWHRANLVPGGSLADIAFSRSTDGGITWSATTRINSVVTGQQFFPSIAVNARGRIKVIYYSTQNSATNRRIDLYEVISDNGGAGFSAPIRVTDTSFDRPQTNPNFDNLVAACYMGDYNQVSAPAPGLGGTDFYLAWGDNRLDGNPNQAGVQPDPDIRFDRNEGIKGCYTRATRVTSTSIRIEWKDLSDYETGWRIFRKTPGTNNFVMIATLGANSTAFTDGAAATSTGDPWEYLVNPFNSSQSVFLNAGLCEN